MFNAIFGRRAYIDEPSPAELRNLRLLAEEGLSNSQIAARVHKTYDTIANQMQSVFYKLGVTTRTAAVIQAMRRGWL